jgi:hypothetical protein
MLHTKIAEIARDLYKSKVDFGKSFDLEIGERVPLRVLDNRREGMRSLIRATPHSFWRNGRLEFAGLTLGNLIPDEGEEWMARTLFGTTSGTPVGVPTNYELGLASAPARGAEAEGTNAGNITEVVGNGYARVALSPHSAADFTISQDGGTSDWQADTGTRSFTAAAGSPLPWTTATQLCLFNPDSPEALIAIVALSADRVLAVANDRIDASLIVRIRESA